MITIARYVILLAYFSIIGWIGYQFWHQTTISTPLRIVAILVLAVSPFIVSAGYLWVMRLQNQKD